MMFTLSYVLNATQTPVSGFELGHKEFKKGDEIISSIISSKIYVSGAYAPLTYFPD